LELATGPKAWGTIAIATTMKNVISTISITRFLSSDLGLKRTTESTSTFLEKADLNPLGADSLLFVGAKVFLSSEAIL
jgi:hypothetical protein